MRLWLVAVVCKPVERIGHGGDRGIETESHRRRLEIVVDRFWNADAVDPSLLELQRGRHRAVAADDDERLDLQPIEDLARLLDHLRGDDRALAGADLGDKMAAIGRADNRSA